MTGPKRWTFFFFLFHVFAISFVMFEDTRFPAVPVPRVLNAFTRQFRYDFLTFCHHKGYDSHICKIKGLCRQQRASERGVNNGGVDILLGVMG